MAKIVRVFTDGAAKSNGQKTAVGGIGVFFGDAHPLNHAELLTYRTFGTKVTNNLAELYAIKKGLQLAIENFQGYEIHLFTDSQYSYNIFTSWAKKWRDNGWVKSDKKPIQNIDLIKDTLDLVEANKVRFHHCNSHRQAPRNRASEDYMIWHGNDQADKLANLMIPQK